MSSRVTVVIAAALMAVSGYAWSDEFPDGATKPSADEIKQYVSGKTFNVKVATGATWRMEFKADGSLTVNSDHGGKTYNAEWTFSDNTLCDQGRGKVKSCNEVRMVGSVLYLKRENGEIIQYTP